ncbi:hypothetical protein U1Q18_009788, partial [Sarracenia purpurea var. burkii]
ILRYGFLEVHFASVLDDNVKPQSSGFVVVTFGLMAIMGLLFDLPLSEFCGFLCGYLRSDIIRIRCSGFSDW